MRSVAVIALGVSAALSVSWIKPASAERLNPQQLRAIADGKVHRGINKRGGAFVITYGAGGSLRGTVEARKKGNSIMFHDQGRWWIMGNRLCVQWRKWGKGKRHCGPVSRDGSGYRYGSGVHFTVN